VFRRKCPGSPLDGFLGGIAHGAMAGATLSSACSPLLPHDPAPLAQLLPELERARTFAAASKADETRRAYTREWGAFSAWCAAKHFPTFRPRRRRWPPTSPPSPTGPPAGIDLALAAIAGTHKAAGHDSPRKAAEVRAVRAGICRRCSPGGPSGSGGARWLTALLSPHSAPPYEGLTRAKALVLPAHRTRGRWLLSGWRG
jgi:hypothetical protein